MSKSTSQNQNEVSHINYGMPALRKHQWLGLIIGSFFLGFVIYFPFGQKLEEVINSSLNKIPGCTLNYNDISLELFLPKIIVKELSVPKKCINAPQDVFLPLTKINFSGISFSPLGFSSTIETQFLKDKFEVMQSIGTSKQVFRIDNNNLNFKTIKALVDSPVDINGDINISALVQTQNNQVEEANINIKSMNLIIPAQLIQIISIPELKLNTLSLKAEQLNPKQIQIQEFIIGDVDAPIRAKFKGIIYPNPRSMMHSQIDLKGEFALSDELLNDDKFSMIKLFLNQYNQKDGFYQIKLTGTLAMPRPSTL